MPINQAALGATKLRDLSGLLGDERVEAVIGSEAGLPVDLALDGLNLWVVRGGSRCVTLIEPPRGAVAVLTCGSYRLPSLAVEEKDLPNAAGRFVGAWARRGGRELALGGLGRADGIRAPGPRPARLPALGLGTEIPGSHAIPQRSMAGSRVAHGSTRDRDAGACLGGELHGQRTLGRPAVEPSCDFLVGDRELAFR